MKLRAGLLGCATVVLTIAACRQVLGVNEDQPLLGSGDGSASDAATAAGDGGAQLVFANILPQGEILTAIWGTGDNYFMAVGTSGVSYEYKGGDFTAPGAFLRRGGEATGSDFNAVWGTSPTDIYTVGGDVTGGGFIQHFDGAGWANIFSTPEYLYGIWGSSDGHILVTGESGAMYGFKPGDKWRKINTLPPNPDFDAGPNAPILWSVSGRDNADWGVAADLDYFFHWEPNSGGLAYYEPTVETSTRFRFAYQGPGAGTSLYFGTNYLGLYWFTAPANAKGMAGMDAAILPVGGGFALAELARDEAVPNASDRYIQGVWANTQKVIAVGDGGRIYVFDLSTATLSRLPAPTDEPLGGVWGTDKSNVWIVGGRELIIHASFP